MDMTLFDITYDKVVNAVINDINTNPAMWEISNYHKCLVTTNPAMLTLISNKYTIAVQAVRNAHGFVCLEFLPAMSNQKGVLFIKIAQCDLPQISHSADFTLGSPSDGYADIARTQFTS